MALGIHHHPSPLRPANTRIQASLFRLAEVQDGTRGTSLIRTPPPFKGTISPLHHLSPQESPLPPPRSNLPPSA